ncbi:MAG TPA: hypothetical protein VNO30_01275 [Kofleriaceae bacterium]|nr:hypothetical protein [Kofleriaceae bacterium]
MRSSTRSAPAVGTRCAAMARLSSIEPGASALGAIDLSRAVILMIGPREAVTAAFAALGARRA